MELNQNVIHVLQELRFIFGNLSFKQTTKDYGGLDLVFFGDPRQMGPVMDKWILS